MCGGWCWCGVAAGVVLVWVSVALWEYEDERGNGGKDKKMW